LDLPEICKNDEKANDLTVTDKGAAQLLEVVKAAPMLKVIVP
jgi:hypothetical protein